eukprot:Pgem_evm1s18054
MNQPVHGIPSTHRPSQSIPKKPSKRLSETATPKPKPKPKPTPQQLPTPRARPTSARPTNHIPKMRTSVSNPNLNSLSSQATSSTPKPKPQPPMRKSSSISNISHISSISNTSNNALPPLPRRSTSQRSSHTGPSTPPPPSAASLRRVSSQSSIYKPTRSLPPIDGDYENIIDENSEYSTSRTIHSQRKIDRIKNGGGLSRINSNSSNNFNNHNNLRRRASSFVSVRSYKSHTSLADKDAIISNGECPGEADDNAMFLELVNIYNSIESEQEKEEMCKILEQYLGDEENDVIHEEYSDETEVEEEGYEQNMHTLSTTKVVIGEAFTFDAQDEIYKGKDRLGQSYQKPRKRDIFRRLSSNNANNVLNEDDSEYSSGDEDEEDHNKNDNSLSKKRTSLTGLFNSRSETSLHRSASQKQLIEQRYEHESDDFKEAMSSLQRNYSRRGKVVKRVSVGQAVPPLKPYRKKSTFNDSVHNEENDQHLKKKSSSNLFYKERPTTTTPSNATLRTNRTNRSVSDNEENSKRKRKNIFYKERTPNSLAQDRRRRSIPSSSESENDITLHYREPKKQSKN